MLDELRIGKKASFIDFGASLKSRTISAPKKKTIKETVPFSNITYDFSKINGELYWDERPLEYVFEIIADKPEELEHKKTAFSKWVMNVMNESIFDPFDPDYHYIGTFDDVDYDDDESIEKTTATVKFTAYPYKIANKPTNTICVVPAASEKVCVVFNDSGHRLTPTINTSGDIIIEFGGVNYSAKAGTVTDDALKLKAGANTMLIQNSTSAAITVTISFFEEVF